MIATPPAVHKIVQVDRTWTCSSAVDLDLVKVTITRKAIGDRRNKDAVHLRFGCTGRIKKLVVVQWYGDGVKVAEGAHDLTIGGGSIRCLGKGPKLHQDGIQVLGGARDTFEHMKIDCGRRNSRLINSNFFVSKAGHSRLPPRDIVCDDCSLGGWAAHTVSVQRSVRSGVQGSTICIARFPRLTVTVGHGARDPVHRRNLVRQCGPGELTLDPGRHIAVFGKRLVLTGFFLGQRAGSIVSAEARKRGAARPAPAGVTHSRHNGRFRLVLRPRIGETVRLRSGSIRGPATSVFVRPLVRLKLRHGRLIAKVRAAQSYAGRRGTLEALRHGRWTFVQRVRIGRRSKAVIHPRVSGVTVRLVVHRRPGYLGAASDSVRLP
ncbi:MAG: hypothetical protein ACXVRE_02430 [Gaiellaceae bacterium]